LYPKECLLTNLVNIVKGRSMVIGPVVIADSVSKVSLSIVGVPLRCVDDPVLVAMTLIEICGDIFDWVPIHSFYATRRIGHRDDVWRDVSQV
jgi:hypothetical protein